MEGGRLVVTPKMCKLFDSYVGKHQLGIRNNWGKMIKKHWVMDERQTDTKEFGEN